MHKISRKPTFLRDPMEGPYDTLRAILSPEKGIPPFIQNCDIKEMLNKRETLDPPSGSSVISTSHVHITWCERLLKFSAHGDGELEARAEDTSRGMSARTRVDSLWKSKHNRNWSSQRFIQSRLAHTTLPRTDDRCL